MKKPTTLLTIILSLVLPFMGIHAQVITTTPALPTASDSVILVFNATLGGGGMAVGGEVGGGGVQLQPWVRVAWENEHKNDDREVRANLVTMGGSFGLPAYKGDDNYGKVDVGISAQFNKSLSAFINYNTTFGQENQKNQAVMVGLHLAM